MTSSLSEIKSISLALSNSNFEENKILLDHICSEIASRFNSYQPNGKLCKNAIIETLAKSSCLACVTKWFSNHVTAKVDPIYKECHKLAVNVLVEELYHLLDQLGYKVMISTEEELEYGKADILIEVTSYGLTLKSKAKELLIEVKTGNSLSLIQIFRYLWDSRSHAIVVWRVRKRQVLTFDSQKIHPLLTESMRMICLRGIRLLSSTQIQSCKHCARAVHQPVATELELMLQDFAKAIIETLPSVLQRVLEQLAINKAGVVGQT